jgi:hypothetical protein
MSDETIKYQNQSSLPQTLVGYGKVLPGQTIETNGPIYNPNFVLVDNRRLVGVEGPIEQPKVNQTLKGSKK